MDLPAQATLIGRIALGAFLGYLIGFEREYRGKSAGERTFSLLALGAAAVTGVGALFFPPSAEKVIAGVITGIGFLGAGLISRERDMTGQGQVLGLTTAVVVGGRGGRDPRGSGRLLRCRYGVRHHPGDRRDQPLAALPQDRPREGAPRRGDRWL